MISVMFQQFPEGKLVKMGLDTLPEGKVNVEESRTVLLNKHTGNVLYSTRPVLLFVLNISG